MSWSNTWFNNCSVNGCDKEAKTKGFCRNHYARFWRNGTTDKLNGDKRKHPLYIIWWQRKSDNNLCEAWLDFETFAKDISPKPDGYFFLLQIDGTKPFGPNNFRWQENLKRKEGESNKDWWARKRAARIAANPAMESQRNIKRQYGLSPEEHAEKLKLSNHVCEICEKPETSFDGRAGTIRSLSVDHCHKTKKLRGMLCGRCNTTIGKVEESIELLEKMKQYLIKYKG